MHFYMLPFSCQDRSLPPGEARFNESLHENVPMCYREQTRPGPRGLRTAQIPSQLAVEENSETAEQGAMLTQVSLGYSVKGFPFQSGH